MRHMKRSGIVGLGGIWSVTAFVANVVVSLALIAVLPIMVIWPFGESHHPSVEVHDEAGVLQSEPLAKEIQAMSFRQDVHVAGSQSRAGTSTTSTTRCWSTPARTRATPTSRGSRRRTPTTGVTAW